MRWPSKAFAGCFVWADAAAQRACVFADAGWVRVFEGSYWLVCCVDAAGLAGGCMPSG